MALELNGTTGVSLVQDGVVTAADLASGAITSAALPAGSVLQVVQVGTVTQTATNSTSYVDATGLSLDITPSSTSSKILIMASIEAGLGVSGANTLGKFRVFRDSAVTLVYQTFRNYDYGGSGVYSSGSVVLTRLDLPNTTSTVNYKIQFAKAAGDYIYVSTESGWSTLTAMEIAA